MLVPITCWITGAVIAVDAELPYNGSSGYSDEQTSKQRALREDADGTTKNRQSITIGLLWQAHTVGLTWRELASMQGWHHGQASSVLSVLHKAGTINKLRETRSGCGVYVLPQFIADRTTVPHGRTFESKRTEQLWRARIAKEISSLFIEHICLDFINCNDPICNMPDAARQKVLDRIRNG